MQAIKSVRQNYEPTEETLELIKDFRLMVNDCIRIGFELGITSMKKLSLASYHALKEYHVASCYSLTAISKASGILRNYRKAIRKNPNTKKPYAGKPILTDCYGFRIEGNRLRLVLRAHEYVYINLNPHTLQTISGHTVRSVTLTACTTSLAYSKEVATMELNGAIGIDRNLDNITIASSHGSVERFDLSKATEIKQTYREVKGHFTRNDARIRRVVYRKYGTRERNCVSWILHNVSASIVKQAKTKHSAIIMEDLRGIRRLYRKGNGQGTDYRARLNSWSYFELQRQIEYKARWEGTPVIYVDARGTSANCSTCGSRTYPNGQRTLFCPRCNLSFDRDENAAKNILARGWLRFGHHGPPVEAVKGNESTTPILRADGGKESLQTKA